MSNSVINFANCAGSDVDYFVETKQISSPQPDIRNEPFVVHKKDDTEEVSYCLRMVTFPVVMRIEGLPDG